jgi:hypothetical protein
MSRSRSFVDLKNAHEDALKAGCCELGIDSTTHFDDSVLDSIAARNSSKREGT